LLDLDDLFAGAAKETEQRLLKRLPQQAQSGKRLEAALKMHVAAPRKVIDDTVETEG